ncbi:hypothetical protein [Streptomyces sp. BPTC-684]|uniref:hypothetical protein n=1 Tax=Streptomyces sp. BPTC-684 TaxID=3043734 RepID=UPI0024B154E2|nr:hypothetical protein [Streptomyces sp. BPTC-684]WHM40779.1 hypothetical protein QIY60_30495 [Streptomyces sp. BPTC-684]
MSDSSKAMNLRFRDPQQREAIAAAAKQAGVSTQEYVLSAAYDRATAVERRFLAAFAQSQARSGQAFDTEAGTTDPTAQQRDAERQARQDLESGERGHAA